MMDHAVKFPSLDFHHFDAIRRINSDTFDRSFRAGYDWRCYEGDQLEAMERYWDAFIDVFASCLPERFRQSPRDYRGINLGTFNGAYQKAWQRAGYDMYGIEIEDVIDELHAYGCAGERASYFNMPEIPSAAFDFAILDRAMPTVPIGETFVPADIATCRSVSPSGFKDREGRFYADKRRADSPAHFQDHLGRSYTTPPFFDEIFRILKPDSALLAILYPYWSDHMLRELNGYGRMTLRPVARRKPYLVVAIDRSQPSVPYRGRLDVVRDLACMSGDEALARLDEGGEAWGARRLGGAIRFLALADNHIVTIDASEPTRVIDDAFWPISEHRDTFFYPSVTFAGAHPRQDGGQRIVCLLDAVVAKGKHATSSRTERHLLWPDRSLLGVRHAHAVLADQIGHLDADWIVIGHYHYDAAWRPRAARFRLQPEDYASTFRDIATAVQDRARIAVAPPIMSGKSRLEERHQMAAFFSTIEPICTDLDIPIIETPAEIEMQPEKNRASKAGRTTWLSAFHTALAKLTA